MKILIVDDHPLVRKGIVSTLSFEKDIDVILEASNIEEALNVIMREIPTLAIVDLNLGNRNGLEIIAKSRNKGVATKFIILTSSIRKEDFNRAMEVGVDGYILKDAFAEDILYAIHVVLRGKQFIAPEVINYQSKASIETNGFNELTPRESDVLIELGRGLSNYEIAKELFISENTVKKHVSNILSKLELSHRTQVALLVNNTANF
ncbi:response regulator transcription factor [Tissierella sp.]|uniref:response regulator transcription factor n=1 Tax=Tissierella sp. TaxID=41274 RepID=UPI002866941D|nr:response regulator transcription factor [Tissierella sp.]MDR7855059.1 response regulator transcription factor [Tissierella sp.]